MNSLSSIKPIEKLKEGLLLFSIFSLLSAMLAPVIQRARQESAMKVCISNMQQLGAAMTRYVQEWDDTYPLNRFPDETHLKGADCSLSGCTGLEGSSNDWKRAIMDGGYLKSREVFQCPANPYSWARQNGQNGCAGDDSNCVGKNKDVPDRQIALGYSYNGAFFHEMYGQREVGDVADPPHLILIAESSSSYPEIGDWACTSVFEHPGKISNWLFIDGHVKTLKITQTLKPIYLWRNPGDSSIHCYLYSSDL
jgi:prepilin-type processing-associated H-X9-DG protein